jgi:hypothetical protein
MTAVTGLGGSPARDAAATEATATAEPASSRRATATRSGYTQTAAAGGTAGPAGAWLAGLGAQPGDLARRVGPFERGQVHHPHGGVQCSQLGVAFDGPGCQRGGSLLAPS